MTPSFTAKYFCVPPSPVFPSQPSKSFPLNSLTGFSLAGNFTLLDQSSAPCASTVASEANEMENRQRLSMEKLLVGDEGKSDRQEYIRLRWPPPRAARLTLSRVAAAFWPKLQKSL